MHPEPLDPVPFARRDARATTLVLNRRRRCPRTSCVVERLFSNSIARNEKSARFGIPNGKSKHASKMIYTVGTKLLVSMNNCFGVGVGLESMAKTFELRFKFEEVINLAVEDDCYRAVFAGDWLMAANKIDD